MVAITTAENDIKERLSVAFLTAVAARAGCQLLKPELDRMSVDATVTPVRGASVKLDIQLKATSVLRFENDNVIFHLPVSNYDHLRSTEVENAQILVILRLPRKLSACMKVSEASLIMRRCAYWHSLYGASPSTNISTVRVTFPKAQLFTPEALLQLMERSLVRLKDGQGGL